ncbi:DUF2336 domain-containing protein [Kordiimonas sp.]|uniref:DUF2336 domain-containing protein n=1 Tax=Kordiimonas sp. TaxID=1970157 RepID=UPI003A8DB5D8
MNVDVWQMQELRSIDLDARVEIARKVGKILARENDGDEKKDALQLAQLLVEDVAVSVRDALAKELRSCSFLPSELLSKLAQDIDQVSMPFLVASQATDDAFLEEIVRNCGSGQQEAIAQRSNLSEAVSFAISDVAGLDAVSNLMNNDTADVSPRSQNRVVDRFREERGLMEKLAARADLSSDVVERIIFKVSKRYGEYLSEKFGLATDYASYLVSMANRRVFSRTMEIAPLNEMQNYLRQLSAVGALTSDVLLTYLQNGNVRLFTMAVAVRLGRPYAVVEAKLVPGNRNIVARLLETAGFSRSVIGVLLIAYDRLYRGS